MIKVIKESAISFWPQHLPNSKRTRGQAMIAKTEGTLPAKLGKDMHNIHTSRDPAIEI
jgi:hypothetical protein